MLRALHVVDKREGVIRGLLEAVERVVCLSPPCVPFREIRVFLLQTSVVERIHSKKNGQVLSFFDVVSYIGMSAAAYVPMAAARITGVESYVKCFVPVSLVLAAFTVIYIAILCVKGRRN